ncbi:MAG: hypothetical protein AB7F78_21240 [Hyphomicrobiaceae bacterium]
MTLGTRLDTVPPVTESDSVRQLATSSSTGRPEASPRRRRPVSLPLLLALAALTVTVAPAAALAEEAPVRTGGGPAPAPAARPAQIAKDDALSDSVAMGRFLDQLMLAESGGRDEARNPRSTAVGPYQFIESTFLSVARRHFPAETGALTGPQILQLRTNRPFARKAAEAYTRDNAAHLAAAGHETTFANLRLAFLVGPGGAARVLAAQPATRVASVLGTGVVIANPFMAGMTTAGLVDWAERNLASAELSKLQVAADPSRAGAAPRQKPAIAVRCSRGLVSCRRWVALATQRLHNKIAVRGRTRAARR